jgi:hypothetical protein
MMSADMAAPSSSWTQAPTARRPLRERGFRQDPAQRGSQPRVAACTTDGPGPSPSPSTCAAVSGWSNPWETTTWERPALMAATVVPTPAWWSAARHRA